jgi:RHS repeat-associated protein
MLRLVPFALGLIILAMLVSLILATASSNLGQAAALLEEILTRYAEAGGPEPGRPRPAYAGQRLPDLTLLDGEGDEVSPAGAAAQMPLSPAPVSDVPASGVELTGGEEAAPKAPGLAAVGPSFPALRAAWQPPRAAWQATVTPTITATLTVVPGETPVFTVTAVPSSTVTATPGITPSVEPPSATATATPFPTATSTPVVTSSPTLAATATLPPTATGTPAPSPILAPTGTPTNAFTPTATLTPTLTPTPTPTPTLAIGQLSLELVPDPATATPGQVVTVSLRLANAGPSALNDVTLSAFLPPALGYQGSLGEPPPGFDPRLRMLAWQVGTLVPGQVLEVSYQAGVAAEVPTGLMTLSAEARVAGLEEILQTGAAITIEQQARPATPSTDESDVQPGLLFIENVGQFDSRARFLVRGGNGSLYLADDALWFTVLESVPIDELAIRGRVPDPVKEMDQPRRGVNLKLSFPGANPRPRLEPFNRLDTKVSYFTDDDPNKWRADVPVWGGVRYVDLYPGVDLEITGRNGRLVQRLVVRDMPVSLAPSPGEGWGRGVRLRVEGAEALALDDDALRLTTAVGDLTVPLLQAVAADGTSLNMPVASPKVEGHEISAPFAPASTAVLPTASAPSRSFRLASPLPIDLMSPLPEGASDLIFSTFLSASPDGQGKAIAVDGMGNAYVTGSTWSNDFPATTGAYDTSYNTTGDVFVVKLNAAGTDLIYATFLGGVNLDEGYAIAIDGTGNAYVTGGTLSNDFPTTTGAYDTTYNGGYDAFVAKLNAAGTDLTYATFLGGSDYDPVNAIAVGGTGNAYVTGRTMSNDFPTTTGAYDTSYNTNGDVFVVKLNAAGTDLSYATFLGGGDVDEGYAIAVDGTGNAYVTGSTISNDFPTTTGAYDTSYNTNGDVFVVKLNVAGTDLTYATFLGASLGDIGYAIAVDGMGNTYVTGSTDSNDFPTTTGAYDTTYNGYYDYDAFVVKLNAAGTDLTYATFLGGVDLDEGYAIAVDGMGNAYVTGRTFCNDFPTTTGAYDTTYNGGDVFVVKLNATGTDLTYATFLGGSAGDFGYAIAVDGTGNSYVTGSTSSNDFPTTTGAYDTSYNGSNDAFVAKLALTKQPVIADFAAAPFVGTLPLTVTFTNSSTGATSYLWDFGDSHTSTVISPTHTYTQAGVYTVSLTADGPGGSNTLTRTNYITVTPPGGGLHLEVGTVTGVGSSDYATVTLAQSYEAMVVIATAAYSNNTLPLLTRVRNARGNSFQVKLQNPSDQPLQPETVHYLVMEAGRYTLPDGRAIEGYLVDSILTDYKGSWQAQSLKYAQSYTSPVVLGQVMSENDPDWSAFWDRGASSVSPPDSGNLWVGKMVGEDTDTDRAAEVLGVVIIEEGAGSLDGAAYRAGVGADIVQGMDNSPPYNYSFSPAFGSTPQVALLSQSAMDGADGSWAVLYGTTPLVTSTLKLAVDEDQIGDSDRSHTNEQVAYLVFDRALAYAPAVIADFAASPLTGTVPLTVTFTNLSTPTQVITSALWAYGDGVISNTLALTHTHTYTQGGVYTVTLSVSDGVVTDTLTRTNYITATGGTVYTTTTHVITYTYDKLYRLTGADYSTGESFAYTYDPVGNRTVHTRTLTSTTVITYAYDAANRLVNVDGVDYTWDANGNLLSDGVRTFIYDAANRLTSVTSGTLTTTFEYDGLGNRMAQTVDGVETRYALDVAGGLPEVIVATTDGTSTYYVQIQRQVLAQQEAGAWAYILPDHLGSVRQLVGSEGQVALGQSYDPFGVPFENSGSGESAVGYTGEWYGSYNELLFLRARYYAPAVGRFISQDPWPGTATHPKTLHSYMYAGSNPIMYTDPSGLDYIPEVDRYTCDDRNALGGYVLHLDKATGLVDWWPCIVDPANLQLNPNHYRDGTAVPIAWNASGYPHPAAEGPRNHGWGPINSCSPLGPDDVAWKYRRECWPSLPTPEEAVEQAAESFAVSPYRGPDGIALGGSLAGGGFWSGCAPNAMIGGTEIVYDFFHQQRATFSYSGAGSRFATSLGSIGATGYVGVLEGFSRNDDPPGIRAYEGFSLSLAGSYDLFSATPSGLPEVVSAGLAAGGTLAAAYSPHMGRLNPQGIRGVYLGLSAGAGASIYDVSVPIAAETYLTEYRLEGKIVNYSRGIADSRANRLSGGVRMLGDMQRDRLINFKTLRQVYEWLIRGAR